jgi:hypothetical protein
MQYAVCAAGWLAGGYGGFNLQLHSPPLCLLEPEPSAGHLLKSGPIRTPSQSGHIECPCRLCKAVVKAGNPLQLLLQQPSSGGQDVPRCTQHKNKQFLIQHGACSTLVVLAEAGKLQKQSAVVPLHQQCEYAIFTATGLMKISNVRLGSVTKVVLRSGLKLRRQQEMLS